MCVFDFKQNAVLTLMGRGLQSSMLLQLSVHMSDDPSRRWSLFSFHTSSEQLCVHPPAVRDEKIKCLHINISSLSLFPSVVLKLFHWTFLFIRSELWVQSSFLFWSLNWSRELRTNFIFEPFSFFTWLHCQSPLFFGNCCPVFLLSIQTEKQLCSSFLVELCVEPSCFCVWFPPLSAFLCSEDDFVTLPVSLMRLKRPLNPPCQYCCCQTCYAAPGKRLINPELWILPHSSDLNLIGCGQDARARKYSVLFFFFGSFVVFLFFLIF